MDFETSRRSLALSTCQTSDAVGDRVQCQTEKDRHILVTEQDIVNLWYTVGSTQGLTTDADVSRFLLSLYFTDRGNSPPSGTLCTNCNTPLKLVCVSCHLSGQPLSSQLSSHQGGSAQFSSLQNQPARVSLQQGLSSQHSSSQGPLQNLCPQNRPTRPSSRPGLLLKLSSQPLPLHLLSQVSGFLQPSVQTVFSQDFSHQVNLPQPSPQFSPSFQQTTTREVETQLQQSLVSHTASEVPKSLTSVLNGNGTEHVFSSTDSSSNSAVPSEGRACPSKDCSSKKTVIQRDADSDEEMDLEVFEEDDAEHSDVEMRDADVKELEGQNVMSKTQTSCENEMMKKLDNEQTSCKNKMTKTPVVLLKRCDSQVNTKKVHTSDSASKKGSAGKKNKEQQESEKTDNYLVGKTLISDNVKQINQSSYRSSEHSERSESIRKVNTGKKNANDSGSIGTGESESATGTTTTTQKHCQVTLQDKAEKTSDIGDQGILSNTQATVTEKDRTDSKLPDEKIERKRKEKVMEKKLKLKLKPKTHRTLEDFMAGRYQFRVNGRSKTADLSHYTCHKCKTVFETRKEFDSHRGRRGDEPCYIEEDRESQEGFDSKSIEILTRVKEKYLLCCPQCNLVFGNKSEHKKHVAAHSLMNDSTDSEEEVQEDTSNSNESKEGKYAILGELVKIYGRYRYYSSYTCSQCKKVFKIKSEFNKHMSKPTCDDDEEISQPTSKLPDEIEIDVNKPREKRKSAQKVRFSEDVYKGLGGSESEEEKQDAEELPKIKKKKKVHNYQPKQQRTLEEFMTGKFRIRIPLPKTKEIRYSHFICWKCNTVFEKLREFTKHKRGRGPIPCVEQASETAESAGFDSRSIEILKKIKEQLLYCCPYCDFVFSVNQLYKDHVLTHHYTVDSSGTHACTVCGKMFDQFEKMYQHMAVPKKQETCSVCGLTFTSRCQISQHMASHPDDEVYRECKRCGKSVSASDWKRHLRRHRAENPLHLCPHCGKGFMAKGTLDEHILSHSDERPFQCSVCNAAFKRKSVLAMHQLRLHEEKKYQCEWCGARFHQRAGLKVHKRTIHLGQWLRCDECGMRFKQTLFLNVHVNRVHKKIKRFACSECDYRCYGSVQFKNHMRVHTGEKIFACPHCPAKFARRDYLIKHARTHTGEKPYACEDCSQRFACVSSLKFHRKKHHSDKTYPCTLCGLKFVVQNSLEYHKRRSHADVFPQEVDLTEKNFKKQKVFPVKSAVETRPDMQILSGALDLCKEEGDQAANIEPEIAVSN